MKTEKSCGAIVFTKDHGGIQYIIIRSREGVYGFPKGHMEGTEREEETALREVLEETGLTVNLLPEFKCENMYTYILNGEERVKRVVYFLGAYSNQLPTAQETELECVQLMDYDSAIALLQFQNLKEMLTKAHSFLLKRVEKA